MDQSNSSPAQVMGAGPGGGTLSEEDVRWLDQELGGRDYSSQPGMLVADYRAVGGKMISTNDVRSVDVDSDRRDSSLDGYFWPEGQQPDGTVLGYRDKFGPYFRAYQDGGTKNILPGGAPSSVTLDRVEISAPRSEPLNYAPFEDGYPGTGASQTPGTYTTGSAVIDEEIQRATGTLLAGASVVHGGAQLASDQFWSLSNALSGGWLARNNNTVQDAVARNASLGHALVNLPRQASGFALRAVTGNWNGFGQGVSNALNVDQIRAANARGDYLGAQVLTTQSALHVAGLATGAAGALRSGTGNIVSTRLASSYGGIYADSLPGRIADHYGSLNARRNEFLVPHNPTGKNARIAYGDDLFPTGRPRHVTVLATGEKVHFDAAGYPVLDPFLYRGPEGTANAVRIRLTSNINDDFKAADKMAGFALRPDGYVWHHHQDLGVMQLVRQDVHRVVPHSGGVAFHNALVDAGLLVGPKYPR